MMLSKTHLINLICALASIVLLAGCVRIPSPNPGSTPTTLPTSTSTSVPNPMQTVASTRTPQPVTLFNGMTPCGRCAAPQLVMDAQGTLHLFWRAGGDSRIGYSQMKPSGKWMNQPLETDYANESYYVFNVDYNLVRNPNGQACVMALGTNFKTNEKAVLVRCFDGTAWRDTSKTSPTSCAYAFAPDGQLRSPDPQKLSANLEAIWGGCKFTIDRNGGYHALWRTQDTKSVLYRFSADIGKTWSTIEELAEEYSVPELRSDAQGNVYYWAKNTYHRWIPNKGWQAPVDLRRYVNFNQYGIEEVKRIVPAPDGRLCALIGKGTGGVLYYAEQLAEDKWSAPILITQYSVNSDLVIDDQGVAHIAYDQWGDVYYTTMGGGK